MESTAIQIDFNGFLSRERNGKMKLCFCPTASPNMTIKCGDWCPFFGEPVISPLSKVPIGRLTLSCQSKLTFEGVILDYREGIRTINPPVLESQQPKINIEPAKAEQVTPAVFPGVITIGK